MTVFIDGEGIVRAVSYGPLSEAGFQDQVALILPQAAASPAASASRLIGPTLRRERPEGATRRGCPRVDPPVPRRGPPRRRPDGTRRSQQKADPRWPWR